MSSSGDVLYICGETLPEAWENSIVALWERGTEIPTQYDKPGDPPSKDCTAIIEVLDPMAEPRIHRCFPGGIEDLEIYRQEVVDGIHDHWVDPENGKWEYCVSGDTKILMSNYSEKQISDCKVGEAVLCYDFSKSRLIPTKIVQTATTKTTPFVIKLENKNELMVSSVHPLYVANKGWTKCKDITKDDYIGVFYNNDHLYYNPVIEDDTILVEESDIRNLDLKINHDRIIAGKIQRNSMFSKVCSIEQLSDTNTLYDIAVEHSDHNFIGNGILCHNTYHERLNAYSYHKSCDQGSTKINQIQYIIDTLKNCPYSRRAQAITWKPWEDCGISDPACLQRIWTRIINGKLQMNVHMRSNDAFKACFMNMHAFVSLQEKIANEVGVPVGKYVHIADSFHLYGFYFEEIEGFLKTIKTRTFEQRTYRSDDPMVIEITNEAKIKIAESLKREKETGQKGI